MSENKTAPVAASPAQTTPTQEPAAKTPMRFEDIDEAVFNDPTPPSQEKENSSKGEEDDDDDFDDDGDEDGEDDLADEDAESGDEEDDDEGEDEELDDDEEDEEDSEKDKKEEGDDNSEEEELYEVKVNGKIKKYSLQSLKNIAASGIHTLERKQQFDAEMKQTKEAMDIYKAQIATAKIKIEPIYEEMKKGNIKGVVSALVQNTGKTRLEAERILRDQMLPVVARRLGLNSEQVNTLLERNKAANAQFDEREKNAFLEEEIARRDEIANRPPVKDESAEVMAEIHKFQVENNVTHSEFQDAFNFVLNNIHNGNKERITVDEVKGVALKRKIVSKVFDAIELKRPKLIKNDKFVDRIVRRYERNPEWTTRQLGRYVERQARKLSEKEGKSKEAALTADISRKVINSNLKSRFESPGEQKKPMKFSDFSSDDDDKLI